MRSISPSGLTASICLPLGPRPPALGKKPRASCRISTSCRACLSCFRSDSVSAASSPSLRPPTAPTAAPAAPPSVQSIHVNPEPPGRRCRADLIRQLQCLSPLLFCVPFPHVEPSCFSHFVIFPCILGLNFYFSTPNIVEGLNRQFRQMTKNKPSFTNDDSLRRMLYLASQRIVKHWHAPCQNSDLILSQLEIMFADRSAG